MTDKHLNTITQAIIGSLDYVDSKIRENKGVQQAIKQRLSFEKWMQFEMAHALSETMSSQDDIKIYVEYPGKKSSGKRSEAIDLVFLLNNEKFLGLELKIVLTVYSINGIEKKKKRMPHAIVDMIADFEKVKTEDYTYYISLGLALPFPNDLKDRNNSIDFPKQFEKFKGKGQLYKTEAVISEDFKAYYYLLANYEIIDQRLEKVNFASDKAQILQEDTQRSNPSAITEKKYPVNYSFNLGNEAYSKGVISFRRQFHHLVPQKSSSVLVIFPDSSEPLEQTFTCSGDNRKIGDRRGEIRKWFQSNFKLGDMVRVIIHSPTEFELVK